MINKKIFGLICKLLCLLLILVLFLVLGWQVCLRLQYVNRPVQQRFTKWVSEDGRISFETNKMGAAYGTLLVGDQIVPIYFATSPGRMIHIYTLEEDEPKELIEMWSGRYRRKDKFIAVVDSETTYYEIGDRITFYRTETAED